MTFNRIINKIKSILDKVNTINANAKLAEGVKVKGSVVASGVNIGNDSRINTSNLKGTITIGNDNFLEKTVVNGNFQSGSNCRIYGTTINGNVTLGKFTSLWGPNLDLVTGGQKITIGSFCSIARNVSFQTFNHNHNKLTSYFIGQNLFGEHWGNERITNGNIVIENDVWIGTHCVILGGVTVHNGAVIAANAVVLKDVPPYSIVAGTPAKVIGYRFENEAIEQIQKLKWWDWPIEKIKKNRDLFTDEVNEDFFKTIVNE